ncbi:Multicopper oxidase with three cupredoxin domains (includes cell division protein FtsP and spore coat protein CotA) [Stigmatella aurantiaca]|uniref:Multicopper oxidase with three cupredoxin domains (Includes cell division protein FtsP and spore coat protein CotA) n=1 Tax=Stigmatella aurantiaca TaxID=41 RepID=A0A1H7Q5Z9_STIAU|nr:Multicopper oxidase with three cupredoxin domains (includes cell division protein FtsP and spore coat protein CotA) [Stigmatella aurantiaca]
MGLKPTRTRNAKNHWRTLLLGAGVLATGVADATQQNEDVSQDLVVKYATNRICRTLEQGRCKEWDDVKLRSYNGQLVGPTIEARPGDTLRIVLDNQLPPEPVRGTIDPNIPHGFNITNLHTHGLHVSPAGNADNVMLSILPGQKFEYEIKIPSDHPAGTFWYHAHKHGAVSIQVSSGMAGALIIRGGLDEVPAIRAARERIFVFQQIPYALINDPYVPGTRANMVEDFEASFSEGRWDASGRRTTINGMVEPVIKMRGGEVQRWRFIHAGFRESLRLKLVRERDPQSVVSYYQIAHDGLATGRLDSVDETEMHPGYRTDVLVRAGNRPETYLLIDEATAAEESFTGLAETRKVLARIEVEGSFSFMPLPDTASLAPYAPFKSITNEELTGTQEARFDMDVQSTPVKYMINGKAFSPDNPPRKLTLGAVEEWRVSSSPLTSHIFHIHVNPFQIVTADGKGIWRDTLFVKANQSVKLRTRYQRYVGKFVTHCHILDHEDQGMMEVLEIVHPGAALHENHD